MQYNKLRQIKHTILSIIAAHPNATTLALGVAITLTVGIIIGFMDSGGTSHQAFAFRSQCNDSNLNPGTIRVCG